MRRDRKAPALYELIRGKSLTAPQPRAPVRPASVPVAPSAPESDRGSWFKPGSVLRLPVGYMFFLIAGVLVVVVVAYLVGYKKREAEERYLREQEAARQFEGTTDPLLSPPLNPALVSTQPPAAGGTQRAPATRGVASGSDKSGPGASQAQPGRSSQPSGAAGRVVQVTGPEDDPRQPGLNYMIAATLTTDEAAKAANFLASKGLEVALVPVDNQPTQRWVVVLQGMGPKEWYGPEGKRLEEQVKQLGREYKRDLRGPETFKDPYWKKFTR